MNRLALSLAAVSLILSTYTLVVHTGKSAAPSVGQRTNVGLADGSSPVSLEGRPQLPALSSLGNRDERLAEPQAPVPTPESRLEVTGTPAPDAQTPLAKPESTGGLDPLSPLSPGLEHRISDLDSAERLLSLDTQQRDELEDLIESTEEEMNGVFDALNEQGVSLRAGLAALAAEQEVHSDEGETLEQLQKTEQRSTAIWNTRMRGSKETYADARRRITAAFLRRAERLLSTRQLRVWKRSAVSLWEMPGVGRPTSRLPEGLSGVSCGGG